MDQIKELRSDGSDPLFDKTNNKQLTIIINL